MSDTVAVVGAAGGIGRALVLRLQRDGARVVALDLPASLARHPPPVESLAIDVLSEAAVADAMAGLARVAPALTGFVYLAGFHTGVAPIGSMATEAFDVTVAGNLRGAFLACRAALPLMAAGGSMVLVSSGLSSNARAGYGAYGAAKAGINLLARSLAVENGPGLRVNAVAPGAVDTAFLRGGTGRSDESGAPGLDLAAYTRAIPLRRIAVADDVVGADRVPAGAGQRVCERADPVGERGRLSAVSRAVGSASIAPDRALGRGGWTTRTWRRTTGARTATGSGSGGARRCC